MGEGATRLRVALVGPCSAGKSTLRAALADYGYDVRHVAQEHSYVPTMWQKVSKPDLLIYLDVDYPTILARTPHFSGGPARLAEEQRRLAHARSHCDLYIDTRDKTPEEVAALAQRFIESVS